MNEVIAQTVGQVAMNPESDSMKEMSFIENNDASRKGTRRHIDQGALTNAFEADRNAVARLLNDALVTERDDLKQAVENSWHSLSEAIDRESGKFK